MTKLCECGCGQPTPLSKTTRPRLGIRVGEPLRFVVGHWAKKANVQHYRQIRRRGETQGSLFLHRQRAERALGHPLPEGAVVHHADGSRGDDAPLVICEDAAYHHLLHQRMRALAAGCDPNMELFCGSCKTCKPIEAFKPSTQRGTGRETVCRECRNRQQRERYRKNKSPKQA